VQGETLAARWDALAFAYGRRRWDASADIEPPTWEDVTKAHHRLWLLVFSQLRHKRPIDARWTGRLFPQEDGSLTALTVTSQLPFLEGFVVQVYEVLRELGETGLRIRFCPICTRPYVSKRADAKVCPTGSCRTIAWRRQNRAKFKAARREAYRRQMVTKTGNPNVRIRGTKKGN